jgi:hypothetical protein
MTAKLFTFLVSLIQQVKSTKAKIALANYCGMLASKNYCGTFREKKIEGFFKSYSNSLKLDEPKLGAIQTNNIVHIFTTTYITGGHTRFLENLVKLDDNYIHHLIVTDQGDVEPRQSLLDLIQSKGGHMHFLERTSLEEQINSFRCFVFENAAKVMMHIHPHDFLPSIAFQDKPKELEVFFFNHADHLFSYGCDVSDTIINIREEANRISVHERFMKRSSILPLPIIKNDNQPSDLISIREKYGVKENDIIGLAIGNPEKFYKNKKHHFFRTISKALAQNPNLIVFIVGVSKMDFCPELDAIEHDRLHFMGIQKDPSDLQRIADIAIDPMPIGSYTALLETCYYGAYPLVCYDTIFLFDLYTDASFGGKINLDLTEESYLEHLHSICVGNVNIKKTEVSKGVKETHTGSSWVKRFYQIIEGEAINLKETTPLPKDLHRFYELNQPETKVRYSALAFFYANIHLFKKREVFKIILHLIVNRYSLRESFGILKKSIQGK